jgi:hypothetical protein
MKPCAPAQNTWTTQILRSQIALRRHSPHVGRTRGSRPVRAEVAARGSGLVTFSAWEQSPMWAILQAMSYRRLAAVCRAVFRPRPARPDTPATVRWPARCAAAAALLLLGAGCTSIGPQQLGNHPVDRLLEPIAEVPGEVIGALQPSNDRNWSADLAVLPRAEIRGESVTVRNIRNCTYRTTDDYTVNHYDKTFDLAKLDTVDFIIVPFQGMPSLAHTMLSFGFGGEDYLAVSVEIRREQGETYAPLKGMLQQFELIYVVGDERDLIGLRTNHRREDVYLYPARATRAQARALFLDVMRRVNQLADHPEFYDTLTNNCTTNIVQHVNRLKPQRVPYDYRVLLPGYSDRLAYELGLLDTDLSFEQARLRARVNYLAYLYRDSPDFSKKIRQGLRPAAGWEAGDNMKAAGRGAIVR